MIQKLWKRNNSLKNRLFQLIMLGTIVSILVSFILARMTISSVEKEQIHSAMQFSLDQICSCFDQGYLNLVNIMQNLAIVVIAAVYLIVSAIASIVLNCLNVSETLFYSVEIIIMVIGIAAVLWGYRGKRYIEH